MPHAFDRVYQVECGVPDTIGVVIDSSRSRIWFFPEIGLPTTQIEPTSAARTLSYSSWKIGFRHSVSQR